MVSAPPTVKISRPWPASRWELAFLNVHALSLTAELSRLIDEETEAKSVWTWEPQLVPGLLQTESYARGVITGWTAIMPIPREEVERRVEARLARQRRLSRDPPLELLTVIDESVLYRKIGSGSVMHEQLEHLVTAGSLPSVRLQILALGGDHPIGTGSFNYMQFTQRHDIPLNDIVNVEQLARNYQIVEEWETLQYQVAFRRLTELALSPDDSHALLLRVIGEHWP